MSGLRPIILVAKDKVDVVVTPGKGGTIGATGKRNGNGGTGNKNNGDNNNNNNNNTKDPDEEKFTITFEANGGKGTMRSKTVKKGSTYSIPKCKFTRNGYSFDGWQLGSGKTIAPGKSIKVESDIILTATWKETNKINADYVFFGHYEQDGNKSNGKEPIEWMVLENKGDTLVLMSKQILVHKVFDETSNRETPVTWADCTIRTWLNKDFLKDAFTKTENNSIIKRKWEVDDNPNKSYGRPGGEAVKDKVTILSREEVLKYFAGNDLTDKTLEISSPRLVAIPTDAIVRSTTNKEGIVLRGFSYFEVESYKDMNYPQAVIDGKYSDWWLRTPGTDYYCMLVVSSHGDIGYVGSDSRNRLMITAGIRPVIEVQSSAVSVKKK